MKIRKYTFFSNFILTITVVFLSSTINDASSNGQPNPNDILVGPTVENPIVVQQCFENKVREEYEELESLFSNQQNDWAKKMAKILGNHASLKTEDGNIYRGKREIEGYLLVVRSQYQEIQFTTEWLVISYKEKKHWLTGKKTHDAIAYQAFTYSLRNVSSTGEILKNQSGRGERCTGRHTTGCECEDI